MFESESEIFPKPVICIIVERRGISSDKEILIQKRSKKGKNVAYKNLWELPQGKIRVGESIDMTAARELKEETNLILNDIDSFHANESSFILSSEINSFNPLITVIDKNFEFIGCAIIVKSHGLIKNTTEASGHFWIDKEKAFELIRHKLVFPLNVPMLVKYFNK